MNLIFKLFGLVLLCTSISSCADPKAEVYRDAMFEQHAAERGKLLQQLDEQAVDIDVVFLGDSHFEFMPLDSLPGNNINLGIRGDTVFAISHRAKGYDSVQSASVIALSLGTNNVANGVKEKTTIKQIESLIGQFSNEQTVLLALLNPLSVNKGFSEFNKKLSELNKAIIDRFSDLPNVRLINPIVDHATYPYLMSDENYMEDGIHFSSKGYDTWMKNWMLEISAQ